MRLRLIVVHEFCLPWPAALPRGNSRSNSYSGCRKTLPADRPVPDPHRRDAAVVAENAQRAGIEQEMLAAAGRQPDPARHQDAQHVAVREQRDVAIRQRGPARSRDRHGRQLCSGVSPPGHPSRKTSQPGRDWWICAVVTPSYSP